MVDVGGVGSTHLVQFYERETFLDRAVAEFFVEGADRGDSLVMIARPRTFEAAARHVDPDRIQFFNAGEVLAGLMDGDRLNLTRCA